MKANYNGFLKLTYSKKKYNKYNKDRPDALPLDSQTSEQFVVYCMEWLTYTTDFKRHWLNSKTFNYSLILSATHQPPIILTFRLKKRGIN